MTTIRNIEDLYLKTLRDSQTPILVYLKSGLCLRGYVENFSDHNIYLRFGKNCQLIFKHIIATIVTIGQHHELEAIMNRPSTI